LLSDWEVVEVDLVEATSIRCTLCLKEVKLGQLVEHVMVEHGGTVSADVLEKAFSKAFSIAIRAIYHSAVNLLEGIRENLEYMGFNSLGLLLAMNSLSLHLAVHNLEEVVKELEQDEDLCGAVENSYLAQYSIYRMHRLSSVLDNLAVLGDLAGGIETAALVARQLVEEIELSAVLDLHRDLKAMGLDEKIEVRNRLLANRQELLSKLWEVVGAEQIASILPGSGKVAEVCRSVAGLLVNVYGVLSSIIHGDPAVLTVREGSESIYKASTYWESEGELGMMIDIVAAIYDALTAVAATWIREAVRSGDVAEEKIKKLFEPIQPVTRISVDLGECYFTRRPRSPAPPGPGGNN